MRSVAARMPLKAFAEGRLFGERFGEEPPRVLALHGWGRTRADLAPALRGLDAVAVDLPGFGATPPPDSAWGAHEYAAAVRTVLEEEFAGPAVVLGHSFGGRVAVCLAAECPDRVGALVLTGVPLLRRAGPRAKPAVRFRVLRALHRVRLVGDARLERARRRHGSRDYRAASGVMRDVLVRAVNETYEEELARVTCPVELVWGELDAEAPLEVAERARALLPEARLTVVAGSDHFGPLSAPELREALERHLS